MLLAHALEELLELDPGRASLGHPAVGGLGRSRAGQTTLLRYLAWSLARAPEPRWVPLFESWSRLMRDREWLLDRIARQLGRAGHARVAASGAARGARSAYRNWGDPETEIGDQGFRVLLPRRPEAVDH